MFKIFWGWLKNWMNRCLDKAKEHAVIYITKKPKIFRPPLKISLGIILAILTVAIFLRPESLGGQSIKELLKSDNIVRIRVLFGYESENRIPVTVFDIDTKTFEDWGQPLMVPRGKLFQLVRGARDRRAGAIVVDVDVSAATFPVELNTAVEELTQYAALGQMAPPLILVRRLWSHPADKALGRPATVAVPSYGTEESGELSGRLKALEAIVDASPNMIWASGLHKVETDGALRFWRPFEIACNARSGEPRAFLAPPVILALLARDRTERRVPDIGRLKSSARELAKHACRESNAEASELFKKAGIGGLLIDDGKVRIPYTFWPGALTATGYGRDLAGRVDVSALMKQSAGNIASIESEREKVGNKGDFCQGEAILTLSPELRPVACNQVQDRVVLIGASHIDSMDTHATPLGLMSGADILANSIMGAREIIAGEGLPNHAGILIGAALFVLMAFMAMWLWKAFAALGIITLMIAFIILSAKLGVDAATAYESVALAMNAFGLKSVARFFISHDGKAEHAEKK